MTDRCGKVDLQATLAAWSADSISVVPHHPIQCKGGIRLFDDGVFACDHVKVGPENSRTQHCLNQSVAILLMEELARIRGE